MDHINSFLQKLKIIIKHTTEILPNDPVIYRINKRLLLAIQFDPIKVFNKVGEQLYKYRNFVYDESTEKLLLEWDFIESKDISNTDDENIASLLISQLKECLKQMDEKSKIFFRKLTIELLDEFLEYSYIQSTNKDN